MQDIAERSGGRIRILPGTLDSTIKKMLADGLVEEVAPPKSADSDDQRRRYYRVTRAGNATPKAETERLALLVKLKSRPRSPSPSNAKNSGTEVPPCWPCWRSPALPQWSRPAARSASI